jgi:hypothetical protein
VLVGETARKKKLTKFKEQCIIFEPEHEQRPGARHRK